MNELIKRVLSNYDIPGKSYHSISSKSHQILCTNGNCFFMKKTNLYSEEKYNFLSGQKCNNIIYPILNKSNHYSSKINSDLYIVTPYHESNPLIDEIKVVNLENELSNLHTKIYYRKELSSQTSKKKLEEIYEYLQYKFNTIESFVRTVEEREFDENSILILKEYHNILDAKKVMGRLNKKIIDDIKAKKVVNYAFIHNNPKLSHLINIDGNDYFISLEKSKIGLPSLDMAKFYLETEEINVNRIELINKYFSIYDDTFYFDYFCFLVMLYYIKTIVIFDKDYVSSQSFVYASRELKKFMTDFKLNT